VLAPNVHWTDCSSVTAANHARQLGLACWDRVRAIGCDLCAVSFRGLIRGDGRRAPATAVDFSTSYAMRAPASTGQKRPRWHHLWHHGGIRRQRMCVVVSTPEERYSR
jgi:hypothetical protein